MNSYININKDKNARRERAERTVYGLTEAGALLVCGILNLFYKLLAFLRTDVVSIAVRGVSACVCAVFIIGTVGACEKGNIILIDAFVRIAIACISFFIIYKLFDNE